MGDYPAIEARRDKLLKEHGMTKKDLEFGKMNIGEIERRLGLQDNITKDEQSFLRERDIYAGRYGWFTKEDYIRLCEEFDKRKSGLY